MKAGPRLLSFGAFRFDPANGILSRGEEEVPLPPRAVAVLSRLVETPGEVVSKQTLLESVWNGAYVSETSLSEAIGLLRQALGDDPQEPAYIQTVHRRGYRFVAAVSEEAPFVEPPQPEPPPPPPPAPPSVDRRLAYASGAVILAALVVASGTWIAAREEAPRRRPPTTRFTVRPAAPAAILDYVTPGLAVSPDGRHIVYVARRPKEPSRLWYRDVAGYVTRELPGTEWGFAPFFSADGRRIGFESEGQLLSVPLAGGAPSPIARIGGKFAGAAWAEDGTLIVAKGSTSALYRVTPDGRTERVTTPDPAKGDYAHRWPRFLPGETALLFTSWTTSLADSRVEWLSFATGERRTVLTGAADAHYVQGMLVWAAYGGMILAAPFDPQRGRLTGEPSLLLEDVTANSITGSTQVGIGGDTLVYLPHPERLDTRTLHRAESGTLVPLATPPGPYRNVRANGRDQLAVTMLARDRSDVWVVGAKSGTFSRLTFGGFNIEPIWSPDGLWVAYASNAAGPFNVFRRRADGSAPQEHVLKHPHRHQYPVAWSRDGRQILVRDFDPVTGSDLWVLDLPTGSARPWLRTKADEGPADWSPDGKWVAYVTNESGRMEIFVRSYPDGTGQWQISHQGGYGPVWSEDGRTIYYQEGSVFRAVSVNPTGPELTPSAPQAVVTNDGLIKAAPAPDGTVFTIIEPPQGPAEVRVVVGWTSTLRPHTGGRP